MNDYDDGAGIILGPFADCFCFSHHQHGPRGAAGCPVCNPPPCSKPKLLKGSPAAPSNNRRLN